MRPLSVDCALAHTVAQHQMELAVVAALLAASLLHASWHALVKTSGDRVLALAGMNLVSGAIALALLPFAGILPAAAYALIAGSVLLHAGYKFGLARMYTLADLGQAYPLARGFTPLAAAMLAFLMLGELPAAGATAGLALVSGGIGLLAFERREAKVTRAALQVALFTGTMAAAYTVVDAIGVRLAGDWLAFTVWLVAADSLAFSGYVVATRRRSALATWQAGWRRVLVSGVLGLVSFGVFMWALGVAPVGPVSALRETSVLFAALIGALVLREPAGRVRYAAALAVMGGTGLIALGR